MLSALTADALFDFMAVRLDAGKAAGLAWKINWQLTDSDERAVMNLQNCTMSHVFDTFAEDAVASVRTNLATIVALNVGKTTVADATASGDLDAEDDDAIIEHLFAMLDNFSMMFDVVARSLKEEE